MSGHGSYVNLISVSIEVESLKSNWGAILSAFVFNQLTTPLEPSCPPRLCLALVRYSFPLPPGNGPFRVSVSWFVGAASRDAKEQQ